MLAFKGCARAMYQSWGVIGIGLSVFSLSPSAGSFVRRLDAGCFSMLPCRVVHDLHGMGLHGMG